MREGRPNMQETQQPLLEIRNLRLSFRMYARALTQSDLPVLTDLRLSVRPGEIVAVVGSSGSGKSLLASAILGILPQNAKASGEMFFRGEPLTPDRQKRLRGREIALVPQSVQFLDPLMRVGPQADGHRRPRPVEKRRALFAQLGLPPRTERLFPFQLSGGMARRVLVSTALLTDAELLIADEPTPGMSLDQALEALRLFRSLADAGRAVVLITHDIDLAVAFADRVAVFYAGTTVEIAPAADFRAGAQALRHPYTQALWRSLPQNDFAPIPGFQPYAGSLPTGCVFAPRCPHRTPACEQSAPPMRTVRGGEVRCLYGA